MQKEVFKVKKRDGRIVPFDLERITNAIFKAARAVGGEDRKKAEKLSKKVVKILNKKYDAHTIPSVEEIQDIVEKVLIEEGHAKVAKAYILYRDQHAKIRDLKAFINSDELMEGYLNQLDWRVRENSNMAYSLQGLNNHVAATVSAHYWLNKIYSPEVRKAHLGADFHIHDLQVLAAYCVGWDLKDLLTRGFGGVPSKIETKPPKHLTTALGQVVNFFYTLQGEAAGAQAFANFDTLLSPFIRYDGLNYKQVKQILQGFLFNINVPTRVGFQTPFTNVTIDITPPSNIAQENVIIGGKPQQEKYKDFQKEMDMFNQVFAEVMLEGDAKGRVFTFPIPTYNITSDLDWENSVLEPVWKMTAKYGIPYFSNFINSDMKPEDTRSMCLTPDTLIIYKNALGKIKKTEIRRIVEDFIKRRNKVQVLINGKFVDIIKVFKLRNKPGFVLKITLENEESFKVTSDHPSIIIKNGKFKQVDSEKLKKGDELPIAKKVYQGKLGDFELGRFVGLYMAEGYLSHNEATIAFSFNLKEKEYFDFVTRLAQRRFKAETTFKAEKRRKSLVVVINDKAVSALIKNYVRGETTKTKRLNSKLFGMSIEFRKGILIGILEGDGHIDNRKYLGRNILIHTSNKGLIDDIALLARSLGINYIKRVNPHNIHFGKPFVSYELKLTNDLPDFIAKYFHKRKGKSRIYKDYEKFYGVKIKSIEKIRYADHVYDFEVGSKKHLFQLANGVITKNCCRLRLDNRELRKRGGGLFGANPLTGSIGVVTINMAKLGYLSKKAYPQELEKAKEEFFLRLEKLMDLAKQSLETKREMLEKFTEEGLYPYSKYYLSSIKQSFGESWKNHFSTIGLNGMNEGCLNLFEKNISTQEGKNFAGEVLDFMREKLMDFQIETNHLYNLEATPAEGTTYRFAKTCKKLYPDLIVANEKAWQEKKVAPYLTNSTHLPINYTDDIFEALDLQDELQTKYTGGTVLHGFLGEKISSPKTVKNLVKKIAENYHLPYYTITPTFSICSEHGYLNGEHFRCPKCGKEAEVYSRVVGYLRPVQQWNDGKQSEFYDRKEYVVKND